MVMAPPGAWGSYVRADGRRDVRTFLRGVRYPGGSGTCLNGLARIASEACRIWSAETSDRSGPGTWRPRRGILGAVPDTDADSDSGSDAVPDADADFDRRNLELARRLRAVCRVTGEFVLRSGRTADEYFDKYQFEADPALLDTVAARMAPLVPDGTEVLAGLEMGGIAVVTALGRHTGLPCAFVRKEAKGYGTRRLAEGADVAGRRVLVVEDVVTSGGQIVLSSRQLRQLGGRVDDALCVIDRQEGGAEALRAEGLALHALFTRTDLERPAADG